MKKVFEHVPENGDFSAYDAAVAWVESQGYSVGSMQRGAPTMIYYGDCDVSKFRNLSKAELLAAAGKITGVAGRFRECPVTVELKGVRPVKNVDPIMEKATDLKTEVDSLGNAELSATMDAIMEILNDPKVEPR